MKKLLSIAAILFAAFILTGCFEDRIYLDFKTAKEIESLGPFENARIYYSQFRNNWNIEVEASTPCGAVQIEGENSSLQDGFNELITKFECLMEKCK